MTTVHKERLFEAPPPYSKSTHSELDHTRLTRKTSTTITTFTRTFSQSQSSVCIELGDGKMISVLDKQPQTSTTSTISQTSQIPAGQLFNHALNRKASKVTISVMIEEIDVLSGDHSLRSISGDSPVVESRCILSDSHSISSRSSVISSTPDSSKEMALVTSESSIPDTRCLVKKGHASGTHIPKDDTQDEPLRRYMTGLNFVGQAIDMALRKFLADYQLPKEAQQIDRVMIAFAKRYHQCNADLFPSPDVVYSIAFSLMLLHTDAHNKHVKQKMSKEQYIRQTRTLEQGDVIAPEILAILYDNITSAQFLYADDMKKKLPKPAKTSWFKKVWDKNQGSPHNPYKVMQMMSSQFAAAVLASKISLFEPDRGQYSYRGSQSVIREAFLRTAFKLKVAGVKTYFQGTITGRPMSGLLITGPQNQNGGDFSILKCAKEGLVSRKCDLMEGGKRTTRRNWKELWMVLSGSQLIFFQDISWFKNPKHRSPKGQNGPTYLAPTPKPHSIIATENCICLIDKDYNTYPNVFRFVTPTGREYLFRYHSEHEMMDWMAKINYAATFKTVGLKPRGADEVSTLTRSPKFGATLAPDTRVAFEEGDRDRCRLVQNKINDLSERIINCQEAVETDGRLQKQMSIMVPLQRQTQQKAIGTASEVSKRLKETYLQLQKWECYKEILEADLVIAKLEETKRQKLTVFMDDQPELEIVSPSDEE
ncbi:hypothetical protein K7432_015178 [Basidiobolus ranarum]|uniref:Uncharacterized protein n=1 Tax=Basidiobolus ranarum TaxID=34480 RepID=A0ABR2VNM1_9FUNG